MTNQKNSKYSFINELQLTGDFILNLLKKSLTYSSMTATLIGQQFYSFTVKTKEHDEKSSASELICLLFNDRFDEDHSYFLYDDKICTLKEVSELVVNAAIKSIGSDYVAFVVDVKSAVFYCFESGVAQSGSKEKIKTIVAGFKGISKGVATKNKDLVESFEKYEPVDATDAFISIVNNYPLIKERVERQQLANIYSVPGKFQDLGFDALITAWTMILHKASSEIKTGSIIRLRDMLGKVPEEVEVIIKNILMKTGVVRESAFFLLREGDIWKRTTTSIN